MNFGKKLSFFVGLLTISLFSLNYYKTKSNQSTSNELLETEKLLQVFQKRKMLTLSPEPIDIQKTMDNFVQEYGYANGGDFTGIHFTVQCPAYNNGFSKTFTSGLQGKQSIKPVTADSIFQIASVSKSFTAVVLLQLEAEGWEMPEGKGKFTIENKVGDFFSDEYPLWKDIKIKQLLNMTSGIPEYFNGGPINTLMYENPYYNFTTEELLNSVKESNIWFQPGQEFAYANTNYVLAGKIIEQLTHKRFFEEIKDRILEPLHMEHTFYVTTFPKDNVPENERENLMSGYYNSSYSGEPPSSYFPYGQDISEYSLSWGNAAAGFVSDISDLSNYARALFSQGPLQHLLPEQQLYEFTSLVDYSGTGQPIPNVSEAHKIGYGLGIMAYLGSLFNWENTLTFYGHPGSAQGFFASWFYVPEKDIFLSYSINDLSDDHTADIAFTYFDFVRQNCFK